jgi:hypothetical protein
MVNRTPLRLVAIEESPPAEDEQLFAAEEQQDITTVDDQSGAPVAMMSEQSAITRKVPESEIIASMDTFRDKGKRTPSLKILIPGGAVTGFIVVALIVLSTKGKSTPVPAPISAIAVPVPSPVKTPQPQPSAAPAPPVAPALPGIEAAPEIIRLVVTSDPMETELSLDGNVLAGHRLNLEVPRDRGIHVVSASAPGYVPFNQQVSFSSDVVLKISLHRAHTSPVHQAAKPRPPQIESGPKGNVRPAAAALVPGLAPGMNLDGPSIRTNGKPIDERNPYKP